MSYYQLKCVDCGQILASVIATQAGELLSPPSTVCPECGAETWGGQSKLIEYVRKFHYAHSGHKLAEVEVPVQ